MTLYRIKTFSDIVDAVLRRGKIPSTDTSTINAIKELINTRYLEVAAERKWRWKREVRDITVPAKYTTGTVTVTVGSRTVTGASTAWVADMEHRYFYVSGDDEHYRIISVNVSAQTMLLSSTYKGDGAGGGASYTIYKPDIGLFPDLDKIEDIWHDYYSLPIKSRGPAFMSKLFTRFPEEENKAAFYTRNGYKEYDNVSLGEQILGYDFLGAASSYSIRIFPAIADEDYTLHVAYSKRISPMEDDDDEPLMPEENRPVLLYGALADFFSMQRNETSFQLWNAKYEKELIEMKGDSDDTDDTPILTVLDRWRKPILTPGAVDLGSFFDKYYSIEDLL